MKSYSLFLLSFFITSSLLFSQTFEETTKVVASDRRADDWFGYSSAIDENYAIVGAIFNSYDSDGNNYFNQSGSAYILINNNDDWTELVKITASDRKSESTFGYAVDIEGNTAVVTAREDNTDENGENYLYEAGSAYVFEKDNNGDWNQVAKLLPSDRHANDMFGWDVAISGNTIAVGTPDNSSDENNQNYLNSSGAIYLYQKVNNQWEFKQKVVSTNRNTGGYFGFSLDIDGDFIVTGAPEWSPSKGCGHAYIIKNINGTWQEVQKITPAKTNQFDWFGKSVSIFENTIVIGAPQDSYDEDGNNYLHFSGSAYIYKNSNDKWELEQKITSLDRGYTDYFGRSVSNSEDKIVIGSTLNNYDENGENYMSSSGSAYIFKNSNNTWEQIQKIVASDRNESDIFGYSVDISGDYIICSTSSQNDDENGNNYLSKAGSAYFFKNTNALGIDDPLLSQGLNMYPNPVKNSLTLESIMPLEKVEIYSTLGQKVKEVNSDFNSISTNHLSNGIYLIRIYSEKKCCS